jgi:hypothetical protein
MCELGEIVVELVVPTFQATGDRAWKRLREQPEMGDRHRLVCGAVIEVERHRLGKRGGRWPSEALRPTKGCGFSLADFAAGG